MIIQDISGNETDRFIHILSCSKMQISAEAGIFSDACFVFSEIAGTIAGPAGLSVEQWLEDDGKRF